MTHGEREKSLAGLKPWRLVKSAALTLATYQNAHNSWRRWLRSGAVCSHACPPGPAACRRHHLQHSHVPSNASRFHQGPQCGQVFLSSVHVHSLHAFEYTMRLSAAELPYGRSLLGDCVRVLVSFGTLRFHRANKSATAGSIAGELQQSAATVLLAVWPKRQTSADRPTK